MNFAAPWMLLGAVFGVIPIVIHLRGRRRAKHVYFAAIDFLISSHKRSSAWLTLEHRFILVARVVAVVACAMMIAKPSCNVAQLRSVDLDTSQVASVVVVIDDTLSMTRSLGKQTVFERAKAQATRIMKLLKNGSEYGVQTVAGSARVIVPLTRKRRAAISALRRHQCSFRYGKLLPAVRSADEMLRYASSKRRHIFVLTDLAKHGIDPMASELISGASLHVLDVTGGRRPKNASVGALVVAPGEVAHPHDRKIRTQLCNHSSRLVRQHVSLEVDESALTKVAVNIPPKKCVTRFFTHRFGQAGLHRIAVRLEDDDLNADNARYVLVDVLGHLKIALVNGSPSTVPYSDELFFLRAALSAARGEFLGEAVIDTLTPAEVTSERLERAHVTVFANVATSGTSARDRLVDYVHRGGGLLISFGDEVAVPGVNFALRGLLPRRIRDIYRKRENSPSVALHLARVSRHHALFRTTPQAFLDALTKVSVWTTALLEPAQRDESKVLMRFRDGSPALITSQVGKGRVLLLTTTIDRDWTDLPLNAGYVPLVAKMVSYLAGKSDYTAGKPSRIVGSRLEAKDYAWLSSMRIRDPHGAIRQWSEDDKNSNFGITAELPGCYQVWGAFKRENAPKRLDSLNFCANHDARESDLSKGKFASRVRDDDRTAGQTRHQMDVSKWFGVVLLVSLLCESLLRLRRHGFFRSPRADRFSVEGL